MYTTTFKEFLIESVFMGDKEAPWGAVNTNRNIITITNTETKKYKEFEFWGSLSKPRIEYAYDLLNAFCNLVEEALLADQEFDKFCNGLIYDKYTKEAKTAYKSCQNQKEKLKTICDRDLYELIEEILATMTYMG